MNKAVTIDPSYALMLRKLWAQANSWIVAANGQSHPHNNPVGRILAKDQATKHLDEYFNAIEALLPKEEA